MYKWLGHVYADLDLLSGELYVTIELYVSARREKLFCDIFLCWLRLRLRSVASCVLCYISVRIFVSPHIISLVYFAFLIRAICKRNRERDRIHANWMIWQGRGESTINALTVLIGLCCGWWYCLGVEWIISNANSYVWLLCVIYGGRHYIDAKRHYQWMSIAWEWNLMALQKINRRQNISFHMFIYIYYYFLLRNQICETILTTTS